MKDALRRHHKLENEQGTELLRFQPSPRARGAKTIWSNRTAFMVITSIVIGLSFVYVLILPSSFATALPSWAGGPDLGASLSTGNKTNNIIVEEKDIYHVRINISETPPQTVPPRFAPLDRLPYSIVEKFYSTGTLNTSLATPEPLDIVYLYVNSSSPYFIDAINERARAQGIPLTANGGHWRENGELRGAIRSAVENCEDLGTIHLLTGVYPSNGSQWAQTPGWLDVDRLSKIDSFKWHNHAEVFRGSLETTTFDADQEEWRQKAMPSFSVFAIEGHFGRIQGLSENVILSNDDMFFMNALRSTDFHSKLYGPVIRLDPNIKLAVSALSPKQHKVTQWTGLQNANHLLSTRFPSRSRNYQHHVPKTLTRASLDETAVIWADEIAQMALSGFQGSRDVDVPWLATWLGIERWREALLWSWTVAKMGEWGAEQRRCTLELLGVNDLAGQVAMVSVSERESLLAIGEVFRVANWPEPLRTTYTFSSMDGHLEPLRYTTYKPKSCSIDMDRCFGPSFADPSAVEPADELFKRLAFERPECGDCLIKALVSASGPRGLEAFLPSHNKVIPQPMKPTKSGDEPSLPLTKDWRSANFSIEILVRLGQDSWPGEPAAASGSVDLRRWCIKLLTRYAYVTGDSPLRFTQLRSWQQTDVVLKQVSNEDTSLAMLCLNDDTTDHQAPMVKQRIESWIDRKWPVAARWERQ